MLIEPAICANRGGEARRTTGRTHRGTGTRRDSRAHTLITACSRSNNQVLNRPATFLFARIGRVARPQRAVDGERVAAIRLDRRHGGRLQKPPTAQASAGDLQKNAAAQKLRSGEDGSIPQEDADALRRFLVDNKLTKDEETFYENIFADPAHLHLGAAISNASSTQLRVTGLPQGTMRRRVTTRRHRTDAPRVTGDAAAPARSCSGDGHASRSSRADTPASTRR